MRTHRGVQESLWALVTAILSMGAGAWVLRLWRADLRIPLKPEGDSYLALGAIKAMLENGWYLSTPALGTPGGQDLSDFGGFNGDNVDWLIIRGMGWFVHDPALLLNLFFLLGFGLIGAAAYVVLRDFRVSRLTSLALSVFYANLSFHFTHGEGHLMLSAYFAVPAGIWLVLRVLTGQPLIRRREGGGVRQWLTPLNGGTAAAIIVVGGSTLYFAVFTLLLLIFATPIQAIAVRSWRSLITGAGAFVAVSVVLALNLAPGLAYRLANGPNLAVAARSSYESELYSFSLVRLVYMVSGHRIDYLSDLGNRVAQGSLTTGEGETLGVILGTTLLVMIGMLFVWTIRGRSASGPRGALISATVMTAVLVFLIGTTGGVGAIIANLVSPQIRAWGRLTPFLALLCLMILAFAVDWCRRRLAPVGPKRVLSTILPLLVAGVAIIDQTSPSNIPDYLGAPARWTAEKQFVQQIEEYVPRGSQILQVPLHQFPEARGVNEMGDYDHMVGYIHSRNLRWSYGAVKGRPADWSTAALDMPLDQLIPAAALAGFAGVWVDNAAYKDNGRRTDRQVQAIVGEGVMPIREAGGRRVFWNLQPLASRLKAVTTTKQQESIAAALTAPTTLQYGQGFYLVETDGTRTWHWADDNAVMTITNASARTQRARWRATLIGADDARTTIFAGDRRLATTRTGTTGTPVEFLVDVPPGGLPIRFETTGTDLGPSNSDPRRLYLQVSDATITNPAFGTLRRARERAGVP